VTPPDIDELVRQARRDGPALSLLSSVARGLRVPFVAPPLRAVVVREASVALPNAEKRSVEEQRGRSLQIEVDNLGFDDD
jgi:hypothetical protein